jgi:hypothetical protein
VILVELRHRRADATGASYLLALSSWACVKPARPDKHAAAGDLIARVFVDGGFSPAESADALRDVTSRFRTSGRARFPQTMYSADSAAAFASALYAAATIKELTGGLGTWEQAAMRWLLPLALGIALVTSSPAEATPSLTDIRTTSQVPATTTTTYVYTLPPAEEQCGDLSRGAFLCQFRSCLKACGGSTACRHLCVRGRNACERANGCYDMHWPFCAGGSFPPCGYQPYGFDSNTCTVLHLVNRTREAIASTSVDGVNLGISLPPGGEADGYAAPSRSGATISAVGNSAGAPGERCEWRVVLKGCLEVGVRRRVVFRQHAASCAP